MRRIHTHLLSLMMAVAEVSAADLTLKSQSEMWADDTMTHAVIKSLLPAAKDEKVVRAQLAGINDSFFKTGLLLVPDEIRFGEFVGYPAQFIRGTSLANFTKRRYGIIVVFTATHTFTIHYFSPESEPLPDPEKYVRLEGAPSQVTEAAFRYVEPRLKAGIEEMREAVRRLARGDEKKG